MYALNLLVILSCVSATAALMRQPFGRKSFGLRSHTEPQSSGINPCWQDLYDDDCSMSNIAAAHFVASDWIKSMPCGEGIEDCDMPLDLTVPDTRPEAGVDHVDVMSLLGLKRSEGITSSKGKGGVAP